jgi:TPR repeat protein
LDRESAPGFQRAAEQGDAESQHWLAGFLHRDAFERKDEVDYPVIAAWYRRAAEQGHAESQVQLANYIYEECEDLNCEESEELNRSEQVKWLRKAAEQGHATAQDYLGEMIMDGEGTARDLSEAAMWFQKASDQGLLSAQTNLGIVHQLKLNFVEAVKCYQIAAEKGYGIAQLRLGTMLERGLGVEKNQIEASKWFQKATEQDILWRTCHLWNYGVDYKNGTDVEQSDTEAARWYRLSAERGSDFAQFSLGEMYEKGDSVVERSSTEAAKWYKKSGKTKLQGCTNRVGCHARKRSWRTMPWPYHLMYEHL